MSNKSFASEGQEHLSPKTSSHNLNPYTHHHARHPKRKHSWLTCANIFFVSCLVFLVFFEIALGNLISEYDAKAVAIIQRTFHINKSSRHNMTTALWFFYALALIFSEWILFFITIFVFLTFDPVLGFQFANAIYFMFYLNSLLQMFYGEPHAYWKYSDIQGVLCPQKYAEPATMALSCMVFWWYFIFMFFFRYQMCTKAAKAVVIILAVVINLLLSFGLVLMG